jgi:ankyrin repeat protein
MEKTKEYGSIKDYVLGHPELAKLQNECLFMACGNLRILPLVKMFVENGADVNAKYEGDNNEKFYPKGTTPLMLASANGYLDIVEFLVKHGANLNAKGEYGSTALMLAASAGHLDVVRFLVEHGADIFEKDKDNKDASNHASDHGHEKVAEYLARLKSTTDLGYMKRG